MRTAFLLALSAALGALAMPNPARAADPVFEDLRSKIAACQAELDRDRALGPACVDEDETYSEVFHVFLPAHRSSLAHPDEDMSVLDRANDLRGQIVQVCGLPGRGQPAACADLRQFW